MSLRILHSWRTLYEWGSRLDESDSKAAIPVYEQALQVAKTGQEKALTLVNLGKCYYLTKEVTKARTVFTDAMLADNNCPEAWYNLGVLAYKDNLISTAKRHFQKTLLLAPGFEDARFYLDNI